MCIEKSSAFSVAFANVFSIVRLEKITLFTSQCWKYTCVFRTPGSKVVDSRFFNDTVLPYYKIVFSILVRTFVISTGKI